MAEEIESNAKEDLPIRQNLIDTAVGFLLNPNVKQRPDDAKIAFLKNKGLTEAEIDEAFNRVKYEAGAAVASNENSQLINAYPLPPYQTPNSFWFHLRSCSSAFISFAVAVYVLHRFYKSYIEPWLFGEKSEQSEMSALKQQLTELNNSVSRLTSTVASLEEAVTNQMHQIDTTSLYDVESVPKSVKDIQEEVSNVKSLLLNRFSFPAPPTLLGATAENKTQNGESKAAAKVVTIPKWQLRNSEHGKSKVDSKEQFESEDKKLSSESSSLENSFSSVQDQTQDGEDSLKIAKDKMQNEDSKKAPENNVDASKDKNDNSKECLENNVSVQDKILDDDSGIESQNYLSNSESTDQINESSVSTKNSE